MRIHRILLVALFALSIASVPSWATPQLRQIGMADVPGAPGFDTLGFAKGMLVMTHSGASTVDIFDPARRRVVAHIAGLQSPRGLAVDDANAKVYVADAGNNSIAVITTNDWKIADTIPVPGTPHALLLDSSGKMLYWSDAQNLTVSLLDTATRTNVGTIPVGGRPSYMALDPDCGLVYVSLQDQREVVAIDSRLNIANRIKLNASQPTGLIYDARTKCLYVAARYAVLSINTETNTEVNRVPAAAGVDMLWLDPESRTVYAAGSGSLLMLGADDQRLTVTGEISTDVKGHTVAYDPEKKMILLREAAKAARSC
jgi:YVTN family beta-propeller protein